MRKLFFWMAVIVMFSFGVRAFALEDAIVGGFRGGMSFGIRTEYHFVQSVALRLGLEGTTGENPLILTVGAHFFNFTSLKGGPSPWFLGAGIVNRSGNNTMTGLSASLIYDPLEKNNPYFAEVGLDLFSSPRLVAEVGYYIVPDAIWQ